MIGYWLLVNVGTEQVREFCLIFSGGAGAWLDVPPTNRIIFVKKCFFHVARKGRPPRGRVTIRLCSRDYQESPFMLYATFAPSDVHTK